MPAYPRPNRIRAGDNPKGQTRMPSPPKKNGANALGYSPIKYGAKGLQTGIAKVGQARNQPGFVPPGQRNILGGPQVPGQTGPINMPGTVPGAPTPGTGTPMNLAKLQERWQSMTPEQRAIWAQHRQQWINKNYVEGPGVGLNPNKVKPGQVRGNLQQLYTAQNQMLQQTLNDKLNTYAGFSGFGQAPEQNAASLDYWRNFASTPEGQAHIQGTGMTPEAWIAGREAEAARGDQNYAQQQRMMTGINNLETRLGLAQTGPRAGTGLGGPVTPSGSGGRQGEPGATGYSNPYAPGTAEWTAQEQMMEYGTSHPTQQNTQGMGLDYRGAMGGVGAASQGMGQGGMGGNPFPGLTLDPQYEMQRRMLEDAYQAQTGGIPAALGSVNDQNQLQLARMGTNEGYAAQNNLEQLAARGAVDSSEYGRTTGELATDAQRNRQDLASQIAQAYADIYGVQGDAALSLSQGLAEALAAAAERAASSQYTTTRGATGKPGKRNNRRRNGRNKGGR